MRLAELSAGYREAAGLLDIQISRLRRLRRGTADAQTRAVLANRLRKLCEARRQCRELALLCEHYYERLTIKSQARNAEERQKFRRFKRGIAKLTSFWTPT